MLKINFKKYLITFLAVILINEGGFAPIIINGQNRSNTEISSQDTIVKVIDKGKVTIDGVSVRSTNSTSGKYLGSLYTGDNVEIIEKMSNGWHKIKYNKSYAYVSSQFIKLSGDKTVDNVLNTGVVFNAKKLTVRESCSTNSKFLGYLPKDTKVYIVRATSTNWYKIKYKNSYAYVKSQYIKLTSSAKVISNENNLNDFLFIGDSFTDRIRNTINSKNDMVYIHAQSGSRPSYWLDKVDQMPDKNCVSGISVLIGVNGITESKNIRDTKALINQLIVKYPDKSIYVQRVFPVGTNFTDDSPIIYNKAISEYNKQLKEFYSTKSNVKIIDATNGFIDNNGYLTNTSDGLHIDDSKGDIFYNNIFNAIKNSQI